MSKENSLIASNKKAYHDYTITKTFESGIQLLGTEIKSIREKSPTIKDGYISVSLNNEAFIENIHIAQYSMGTYSNHSPKRKRKLLLHKQEINTLKKGVEQKGYTIVPLKMYFSKGVVKLEIGLAKGKKLYDKRQALKEKEQKREIQKQFQREQKYNTK